jgi:DNA-binding IclR family transcriptional regulator
MPPDSIPDELRSFIHKHIDSVAELEALLLLRRECGDPWDPAGLGQRLYIPEAAASEILVKLSADGLIAHDPTGYRCCPDPELAALLDSVEKTYREQLIPMTHLIHSKLGRIREFANAFKFRKDR